MSYSIYCVVCIYYWISCAHILLAYLCMLRGSRSMSYFHGDLVRSGRFSLAANHWWREKINHQDGSSEKLVCHGSSINSCPLKKVWAPLFFFLWFLKGFQLLCAPPPFFLSVGTYSETSNVSVSAVVTIEWDETRAIHLFWVVTWFGRH